MAHTRLQGNGSFGWLKALLVWLALLALLCAAAAFLLKRDPPKLVYPRPGQDAAPFAHTDALGYLNHLRREAGLAPFSLSPLLARSAADHARYLNDYPDDMHDEKHADHPYFRGKEPDQRVAKAGYLYLGVQENLSTGEHEIPLGAHRLQQQYLDGLMTAIYHRFSLLDPAANEAGIGFSSRNNRHALVVNQGNRDGDRLCRKGRTRVEEERLYYDDLCANKAVFYSDEIRFDLPEYTVYPVGSLAHPVFSNETPNPLPDREYSGNPVSISFNGTATYSSKCIPSNSSKANAKSPTPASSPPPPIPTNSCPNSSLPSSPSTRSTTTPNTAPSSATAKPIGKRAKHRKKPPNGVSAPANPTTPISNSAAAKTSLSNPAKPTICAGILPTAHPTAALSATTNTAMPPSPSI
ncbi:CAP domain-containing protein [Kingella potus]|uniref:CAP domain-containing protein n=1 Tax=Kingella potus TaxID=265175 RepID=UPI001FD17F63|nr:CAP domain-containing protein [Kingella potus]UOP01250.1 CAP domain-containing protein [Kingella potus]